MGFSFRYSVIVVEDLDYENLCANAESYRIVSEEAGRKAKKCYKCPHCDKTFQYKSKFLMHSVKHSSVKTCICPICNKLLKSRFCLKTHLKFHDGRVFKCTVCQKSYSLRSSLESHVRKYPPNVVFPCNNCSKKYHTKTDVVVHQARDHVDSFTCFYCNSTFSKLQELTLHVLVHTATLETPPKYQCEFCGRVFAGRQTLNVHRKSLHLNLRSVVCEMCGKKLTSVASLNNHLLMHRGEKPLRCEHCGKQFLSRNTLNVHRRTHTGEKRHGCPYCDKRFTQRNSLVIHIRKHTGDRPFECEMCSGKFISKNYLKVHRKSKHQLI